jgi:hypothetical protein
MKVSSIRYGFATNSSSSHSIVFKKDTFSDDIGDSDVGQYGWNDFTLVSPIAKQHYMLSLIIGQTEENSLERRALKDTFRRVGKECAKQYIEGDEGEVEGFKPSYVDHQSSFTFPYSHRDNKPNSNFLDDVIAYIGNNDQIVILGGNDNGDGHYLSADTYSEYYDEDKEEYVTDEYKTPNALDAIQQYVPYGAAKLKVIARKDKGYWAVFNQSNGTKIRFTLNGSHPDYIKSTTPELVDVKITDYCETGCSFCYQGSSTKGKHATLDNMSHIIKTLGDANIFEVAIGGGEPTTHPDFIQILEQFRKQDIIPNFTTRNIEYVRKNSKQLDELGANYAVSISNSEDILNTTKDAPQYYKFNFQYVMGSSSIHDFYDIITHMQGLSNARITLLDFKPVGRGESFDPNYYNNWLIGLTLKLAGDKIKDIEIGIDTGLARKYEKELLHIGIDEKLFETKEGCFSMYIDAVNMTMAKDSYSQEDNQISPFNDKWISTFQTY